ncbi:hypothetical protein SLS55_007134 [Diplodia seriata]|uniref:Ankyrin repeat protein n=1 Tax=Diplodia seriata TaxID=420778 RepID=A0ABR3CBD2_9PEZI
MADPIGIASGIAGLVTIAWQIVNLSHSYISDVRSADRSRARFEQELLALTSVLLQAEDACQEAESLGLVAPRPAALSANIVSESHVQLLDLRSELQKHSSRLIWPFREKELRKHVDALQRLNAIFSAFVTSNVLSRVIRDLSEDTSACILYFFCDFSSRTQQSTAVILRSILLQLAEQGDPAVLSELNKQRQSIGRNFSTENLAQALHTTFLDHKNIFLVLDAPDELETPKEIVSLLQAFAEAGCKVCVTSRDIPEVRGPLSAAKHIHIRNASPEDLATYIRSRFAESDFCDALTAINDIVDAVVQRADGIFLLAKLFLDQLLELSTLKKIRKTVKSLPVTVSEAFKTSLERIEAQPKDKRELAHRLIRWITHSHRRLKAIEVMHAFAVDEDEDEDEIDSENCPPLTMLLKVCAGLVTENPKDGTIGMVHTSAYEFFRSHYSNQYASIQVDIAKTSLLYLSSQEMRAGACENLESLDKRLEKLPFLPYAARYWGKHIEIPDLEEQLTSFIMTLIDDEALRSSSFQVLQNRHGLKSPGVAEASFEMTPRDQQPLHIAAYWGLEKTAAALLARGDDPSVPDSQGWTPLHWAVSNSNSAIVKVLIDGGARLDATDSQGWTPLFWTAFNDDIAILQQLLESGAQHLVRDISGWTALKYAISRRHFGVVQVLVEHYKRYLARMRQDENNQARGLSFEQERDYVEASIEMVADMKNDEVPSLLEKPDMAVEDYEKLWSLGHFDRTLHNIWRLREKAEMVNGPDYYIDCYSGNRPPPADDWKSRLLHVAIKAAQPLVLQLLIELGADVNFNASGRNVGGRTPLHTASFRKDPQFVEILLQHGADASTRDHSGLTALHMAVMHGFDDTVAMLLKWNSDPNARSTSKKNSRGARDWSDEGRPSKEDGVQMTPLMLACGLVSLDDESAFASSRIIELLIASHADANLKDYDEKSCLLYAIKSGHPKIVRQLLDAGADVHSKDRSGRNALHYAARYGNLEVVKMVIDAGAEATIDKSGRNAFHHLTNRNDNSLKAEEIEGIIDLLAEKCGPGAMSADWDAPPVQPMMTRPSSHTYTRCNYTFTPLSLALKATSWKLFEALEERGAAFNTTFPLDHLLFMPVHQLQPRATRFLLDRGAWLSPEMYSVAHMFNLIELKKSPENLAPILEDLPRLKVDINAEDKYEKRTMLLATVQHINSEVATQSFLDAGADPFKTDNKGLDAFLQALLSRCDKALRCLIRHAHSHPRAGHWTTHLLPPPAAAAADPAPSADFFASICTALSLHGSLDALHGAPLGAPHGLDRQTLLQHFAALNDLPRVQTLLAHGASPEIPDQLGWRALHTALHHNAPAVAAALLAAGADPHAATTRWRDASTKPSGLYAGNVWKGTPLHLAAMCGNVEAVALLLARGVDVDASTGVEWRSYNAGHGPSALRIALDTGTFYGRVGSALDGRRLRVAEMLVEAGAATVGVAEHLVDGDILAFGDFPALWKRLRG